MAATDVNILEDKPSHLPETSYRVCSVISSNFTGLARCEHTDVYGRYVFIKAPSETKLKLSEVEVFPFRECHDGCIFIYPILDYFLFECNYFIYYQLLYILYSLLSLSDLLSIPLYRKIFCLFRFLRKYCAFPLRFENIPHTMSI